MTAAVTTPVRRGPNQAENEQSLRGADRAEAFLAQAAALDGMGRAAAQQDAVLVALDLADAIAQRYSGRGIDLDDLRQVARMGLVKAVRGYRPDKGNGFAAYAIPTITGEVKRHFRDCGWAVRPPRRLQEMRADLAAEEDRLRQELGREPTVDELAAALEVAPEDVAQAHECCAAYRAVSLDGPSPGGTSMVDTMGSRRDDYDALATRAALGQAVRSLSRREQQILRLRFVEDLTQTEIGRVLGVSQMQVSRLLSSIVQRLRQQMILSERAA